MWPVIIGGVLVWRVLANRKRGVMTLERKALFRAAMHWNDPARIGKLADIFEREGLPDQAKELRARATLPAQVHGVQAARQVAVKKALSSKDPRYVRHVAGLFAKKGASNTAELLQQYAIGLEVCKDLRPIRVAGEIPEGQDPDSPDDAAPDDGAPDDVAPDDAAPDDGTSDDVAPDDSPTADPSYDAAPDDSSNDGSQYNSPPPQDDGGDAYSDDGGGGGSSGGGGGGGMPTAQPTPQPAPHPSDPSSSPADPSPGLPPPHLPRVGIKHPPPHSPGVPPGLGIRHPGSAVRVTPPHRPPPRHVPPRHVPPHHVPPHHVPPNKRGK